MGHVGRKAHGVGRRPSPPPRRIGDVVRGALQMNHTHELMHGAKGLKYSIDTVAVAGAPLTLLYSVHLSDVYVGLSIIWVGIRIYETRLFRGFRNRIANWIADRQGK